MAGEHEATVGVVFSTGDRYDGFFNSDEWSGPGRELRPYWWWWCICDVDGTLHATEADAKAEARAHTDDVRLGGPMPMVLPGGPPRTT